MEEKRSEAAAVLGFFLCLGLVVMGVFLWQGAKAVKGAQRTVEVKGLSEREVPADVAIWPIRFVDVDNDLAALYSRMQTQSGLILNFLKGQGFAPDEITVSAPSVTDRQAQNWGDTDRIPFRYSAEVPVTVYSHNVDSVRKAMNGLGDLVGQGVVIRGEGSGGEGPEFLFTGLNAIKPAMVEEATRNARLVAEKFAQDSGSALGKIKTAQQGVFSIEDRDGNTPYIKKVRVVSTVVYFLAD